MDSTDTSNIIKPKDVNPALLKRIENNYGPVDMENDFFKSDLSIYYKTIETNPETGSINRELIKLASFGSSLKKMSSAVKALKQLMATKDAKNDQTIQTIADELKKVFNKYRTHLRKNYPDQYNQIKSTLEEISMTGGGAASTATFTPGLGGQYATPFAFNPDKKAKGSQRQYLYKLGFKPVKTDEGVGATLGPGPKAGPKGVKDNYYVKKFGYKLVPDKIPGSGIIVRKLFEDDKEDELSQQEIYHKERIADFDIIKKKLDNIYKLNNRARLKTKEYYKEFPESYAIAYSTGLIKDYLKDIEELYKDED